MKTFAEVSNCKSHFAYPERILVATDLTDGEYLIPHIVAQAQISGAHVTLVHAILPVQSYSIDAGAIPPLDPMLLEEEAYRELHAMAARIESHGIPCEVVAKEGLPANVIQRQAEITCADRLIMATHGRGKWGQLVLGSVANQLLGSVQIPVFAVGPRCQKSESHASPRRILHPVSMSGNYKSSVRLAVEVARAYHAELILLHIPERDVEQSIHPGCTLSWAENLAAALIPETKDTDLQIRVNVAFGNKTEEIRKEAVRIDADWIVLGVEEGQFTWPLGESTAYKVMAAATCPVFAVPLNLQLLEYLKIGEARTATVIGERYPSQAASL